MLFGQQGINNNWLLGYGSQWGLPPYGVNKIDFNSGIPLITSDSMEMEFRHTLANISDTAGNLLFYTNGYYIADATNDTMQNGSGLSPSLYTSSNTDGLLIPQGAIVIPKPGSNSIYYLFHSTIDNYLLSSNLVAYHLYKTEIDISLNNGLGAVISKNVPILNDTLNAGKISACKHANGRDWWLIVHKANSDIFYKFLITPNVILGPYTQSIGVVRQWDAGQALFSPDGSKFAYYYVIGGLDVFDFNRCSGAFTNPIHRSYPYENGYNVGVAFSSSSNALYVSNINHVYQYDLVNGVNLMVAAYDTFECPVQAITVPTLFSLTCLAPDGKIYITTGNSTFYMHTIEHPDSIGLGCDVLQHSILFSALYFNTVPNHPNYFLDCDSTLGCLCAITTNLNPDPLSNNMGIKVFSNPTTGKFTLQFNVQSTAGVVEVYDTNGKLILKQPISPWSQYKQLDITKQPSGIYYCKLKWGSGEASAKVIKE